MNRRGPTGDEPAKDSAAIQEAAAGVVHGVYRAVKACQFHADVANDAVTSLTASGAAAVAEYCLRAGSESVALSFLGDAIFVNRQILKASRDTHALAAELRGLLETCEVTELTLARTVDRAAMSSFAKLLADVQRDRSLVARLTSGEIAGVTAGKARFAATGASREEAPGARAARTYATSVLTVQGVLAEIRQGKYELPRKIKRVAQQLVARAEEDARLLVALAATGGVSLDAATVAVGSAILSVAMARQLSTDRAVLANAAMTALLYDAGRVVLGASPGGLQRSLNDDELDRVPARSVVALTALARMHAPARARTCLLYEVWSMRRAHRRGLPYNGRRPPTLLARIIGVARAFAELRGAGAGGGLSIDDALQVMVGRATDGTERALVKLLIGALGIYPAGTMVTLNTGELGVVMSTPAMPLDYVRPQVKILYDHQANLLETPIDVDLAAPTSSESVRFIWKSVEADEQQMKAMRAFVVAATAAKRRGALDPEEEPVPRSARSVVESAQQREGTPVGVSRPERTLQSAVEDVAARRVERQLKVVDAEIPGVTVRPVTADVEVPGVTVRPVMPAAPPPSSRREPIFVNAPPPPSSQRLRGELHEPTPRSMNVAPPGSSRAQVPPLDPAPPAAPVRRRDPRNDSEAPSSMQDEIHRPVPVARGARVAEQPAEPPRSARELLAMQEQTTATHDTETVRPPPPSQATESDEMLLDPQRVTARPPPPGDELEVVDELEELQVVEEEPTEPESARDDLLAAFLADDPINTVPPPKDPEGG